VLLLTRHERVLSVRFMVNFPRVDLMSLITMKVVTVGILSALGAPVIRIRSAGAYPATSPTSPGMILFMFALPVVEPSIGDGPRVSLGSIIVVIPHIMHSSHDLGLMSSVLDASLEPKPTMSLIFLPMILDFAFPYPSGNMNSCLLVIQSNGSSSRSAILWRFLPFSGLPFCLLVIFAVHSVLSAGVLLSVSV
jgi:disulfide bond formation protein DsbB